MNRPTFRHPASRDEAWGRYYARRGCSAVTRGCRTLSNAERLAVWRTRYEPLPLECKVQPIKGGAK